MPIFSDEHQMVADLSLEIAQSDGNGIRKIMNRIGGDDVALEWFLEANALLLQHLEDVKGVVEAAVPRILVAVLPEKFENLGPDVEALEYGPRIEPENCYPIWPQAAV